ncbi:hypothetical protein VN97_g1997 [Penicillium thymicola]|uniref:Uncharacterized protein n=1 Tax=Penicillium thymicola TaxID=293382 RepID=A0AAI9TRA3_PENTH|nr:hypothetical protein VN97_g1997 [Penicillium thymicola]
MSQLIRRLEEEDVKETACSLRGFPTPTGIFQLDTPYPVFRTFGVVDSCDVLTCLSRSLFDSCHRRMAPFEWIDYGFSYSIGANVSSDWH